MQAVLGSGHEAIEQRSVEAMQILERVVHSKIRAQVEMQLGVAYRGEVDQNHIAVGLLQSDSGVDSSGGGAGASLGAEKGEDAGFARAPASASAVRTEAGQRFE